METMPEIPDTAQFTIRPNWICEVLSPSTMVKDRNRKLPIYAAAGVVHAWLVDPIAKTISPRRGPVSSFTLQSSFQ